MGRCGCVARRHSGIRDKIMCVLIFSGNKDKPDMWRICFAQAYMHYGE